MDTGPWHLTWGQALWDLVCAAIGAAIGLILGVLFSEPLKSMMLCFRRRLRWLFFGKPRVPTPEAFVLGSHKTSYVIVDGDGQMVYTPDTLECVVIEEKAELPADVMKLYSEVATTEEEKKAKGLQYRWNGPLYALDSHQVQRTSPYENLALRLWLRITDYYTFMATVLSLDRNLIDPPASLTLRDRYLAYNDPSKPIPFLANGLGVALVIITEDGKLILSRRQETLSARPGELDVSVVEGVHPFHDRHTDHAGPDLYRTAIRGAMEELGVTLLEKDVTFLGFGVDMEYYQWNVIGMAEIAETAQQILERRTRGTAGKWEAHTFESVDAVPRTAFEYLKTNKMWGTGKVAIYWALVKKSGKKRVEEAVRQVFG